MCCSNSVNMNIARVLGPAIGGLAIFSAHLLPYRGRVFEFAVGDYVLDLYSAHVQPYYVGKGIRLPRDRPVADWRGLRNGQVEAGKAERVAALSESMLGSVWKGVHYAFTSPRLLTINARIFLFMVFAGILPTAWRASAKAT